MSMLLGMRIEWTEHSAPWLEAIKDRLHDETPVANDKGVGAVFNSVGRGICGPLYVGVVASDIFNYRIRLGRQVIAPSDRHRICARRRDL